MSRKLTVQDHLTIKALYFQGANMTEISKKVGRNRSTIYDLVEQADYFDGWLEDQMNEIERETIEAFRRENIKLLQRTQSIYDLADKKVLVKLKEEDLRTKDANQIAKDYFNRRQLLLDRPTENVQTKLGVVMMPSRNNDKPTKDILETTSSTGEGS